MQSDTLIVPRRQSGVTAYFVSENAEITASDKGWDTVSLTARKLAVLTKYSSELSEDSVISIADDLAQEIAYAFADKEDECLFNGDGTSTYGGIVGLKNALGDGSEVTAITGNTAFSTLDLEDFEAMVGKLPQFAVNGARWYISRVGWANSMLRLAEAAGGNTVAQIAGGAPLQFLGFPVEIVQVMNSTTTAQTSTDGIAYLGNLDLAASMGSRRGISIAVDSSRYFEFDQLAIRGTERFDINVHEKGTASVAGPVIMLKTPGS
jgi:HK97 family phage major capsid protein